MASRAWSRLCAVWFVCAPAVAGAAPSTWGGAGANNDWSTAANWDASPAPGTSLVFPQGALQLANNNDLSGYSFAGLSVDDAYHLQGNAVTLDGDIALGAHAANAIVSLPITLGAGSTISTTSAPVTFDNTYNLAAYALTVTGPVGADVTFSNAIDSANVLSSSANNSGGIIKNGANTLFLNGNNAYYGTTTINDGVVVITNPSALGFADNDYPSAGTIVSGQGQLAIQGTLVDNIYTSETLVLDSAPGAVAISAGTGNNSLSGSITLDADAMLSVSAGNSLVLSGAIVSNGSYGLTLVGGGTFNFSTTNGYPNYAGPTTIAGSTTVELPQSGEFPGAITVEGGSTLLATGASSGSITLLTSASGQGATIGVPTGLNANLISLRGGIVVSPQAVFSIPENLTLSVNGGSGISGAGNLNKTGAGNLGLAVNNTYTGTTNLNGGVTITVKGVNSIPDGSDVTVAALAELELGGGAETIGSLAGAGVVDITNTTLTTGDTSATTFSGVIQGSGGALVTAGSGTLTLSGSNTYTGTTTVGSGALNIDGGSVPSAITVTAAGRLGIGHSATVGAITTTGGTVAPAANPAATCASLSLDSGATFAVTLGGTGAGQSSSLIASGAANLAGATLAVELAYSPVVGDTLSILTASGGVMGTFGGLAEGGLVSAGSATFVISYAAQGGKAVTLTTQSYTASPDMTVVGDLSLAPTVDAAASGPDLSAPPRMDAGARLDAPTVSQSHGGCSVGATPEPVGLWPFALLALLALAARPRRATR